MADHAGSSKGQHWQKELGGVVNTLVEGGTVEPPSFSPQSPISPSLWTHGGLEESPATVLDDVGGKADIAANKQESWIRVPRQAGASPVETQEALRSYGQPEKRYGWLGKLGEGGSGEVLLVKDHLMNRRVAMKRIRLTSFYNAQRFLQEVRVISRLEHPNIVPVYDVGVDREGCHFFTMKFVEGDTLASVIKKLKDGHAGTHKLYPWERRVRIFLEILKAIHYAHDQGVLHLDLKPSNIMLGAYGEVVVMDWGSSRHLDNATAPEQRSSPDMEIPQTLEGTLLGTPAYMSPEQALGQRKELDRRSDIYSLCVLFYEFLCLRHYLEHKQNLQELLFAIVSEQPTPADTMLATGQGRVPRDLWFILQKGLYKDRQLRYASVAEMITELEQHLAGRPSIHCPSTLLKRWALDYAKFLDTYRTTGVVIAVGVIVLVAMGIYQFGEWLGKF